MRARVIPTAKSLHATYYGGLRGYKFVEKVAGRNTAVKVGMWHNRVWLTKQMKHGVKIIDIGPVHSEIASPFYAFERNIVTGYWNYVDGDKGRDSYDL